MYNVSLPILQFSPVNNIPPMLHTHSFTYHTHYKFLFQYLVFPCKYHSTNAPYPFIHLPLTQYNVSLPVHLVSPVSTIPPMIHTHSFTYHPLYIMFLSNYFSFPCQYDSTIAQYPLIHLPRMLCIVSLTALQFLPVIIIPPMLHTHSFTHHPGYIMFLSQYFSFPLSVPFHHCPIPIHSPTTCAI